MLNFIRRLLRTRTAWFFAGVLFLPFASSLINKGLGPTARQAMPFTSYFEESRHEFFFPADYDYKLRSKGTEQEFREFVKKMGMEGYHVNDLYYENVEGRNRSTKAYYRDGFIVYEEVAS